jgi:NHL repeat
MTPHLRLLSVSVLIASVGACGGGSAGIGQQPSAPTSPSAAATSSSTPTSTSTSTLAPTPTRTLTATPMPMPTPSRSLAVVNATSNSITVFAMDANGDATPLRTVAGPHTGLANPTDVAADPGGRVYVVNNGGNPFSVTVYAAGAAGDALPIRTIAGSATGLEFPVYARVDTAGTLYVSNAGRGGPFSKITEYAADANGNVAPVRILPFENPQTGLQCFFPGPLAIDAAGNLLVASDPVSAAGEIATYPPGATDCTKPLRALSGAQTLLTGTSGLAVSSTTGRLVVSEQELLPPQVVEFSSAANGNTAPLAAIAGASTGLLRPAGVAVDDAGSVYVANTTGNSITVYASTAVGDSVPVRTIRGPHTGLNVPGGIAILPN